MQNPSIAKSASNAAPSTTSDDMVLSVANVFLTAFSCCLSAIRGGLKSSVFGHSIVADVKLIEALCSCGAA
jgi:hypothetical protein